MSIWGAVKNALNSTMGTTGFKSLDKLIEDKITSAQTAITAEGGVKCVKSVQTGTTSSSSATVTISPVDVNKSVVILQGNGYDYSSSYSWAVMPTGYLSSSTKLALSYGYSNGNPSGMAARWFVIEFY